MPSILIDERTHRARPPVEWDRDAGVDHDREVNQLSKRDWWGRWYNRRPQEAFHARTYVLHDLHAVLLGDARTAAGCAEPAAGGQAVRRIGRRDGHDREGQERAEAGPAELR